jgi:hypothetical protein
MGSNQQLVQTYQIWLIRAARVGCAASGMVDLHVLETNIFCVRATFLGVDDSADVTLDLIEAAHGDLWLTH